MKKEEKENREKLSQAYKDLDKMIVRFNDLHRMAKRMKERMIAKRKDIRHLETIINIEKK